MAQSDDRRNRWYRILAALQKRADVLGARRDPDIDHYLCLLEEDLADPSFAEVVSLMLDEYEEEQRHNPNYLERAPEDEEELYGPGGGPDFPFGRTTETQVPYAPRIVHDCSNMVLTGIAGAGKTTGVMHVIDGVFGNYRSVATIVFDIKGDLTCEATHNHPHVHVHKARSLRFNPLRPPPGVPLEEWLTKAATIIVEYRGLKKSRHVLLQGMKRLCQHFGVDRDPSKPWPSLPNALDYVMRMPGSSFSKHADYKGSLVNELQGLLDDTGEIFDTSDGIDIDAHMLTPGGIFVLQMETLDVPAQQVIISLIVMYIIHARIARNVRNPPLEVLIVLDEAQLVLSLAADRASANGIAPVAQAVIAGREMGVGFIIVPHLLPDISRVVCAEAKTLMTVGGLGDSDSIEIASRMMNLPARAKTMIPRLGRGQALVREIGKGGSYSDAFLVDIDPPTIAKDAVDEPTRQRLMAEKLARFPATPSKPLEDYPPLMAELRPRKRGHKPASSATPAATDESGPADDELDLLLDCVRHPYDYMGERQTRLNIRDYKVIQRVSESLQREGLVCLHSVRLGRKTFGFIEVMDEGFAAIGRPRPPHYIGHGSFVHTLLMNRVAKYLGTKGWTGIKTEHRVGTAAHAVDVYARSPKGVTTGIEITLSRSNVCSNAMKSLTGPGGVERLIFLCPVGDECKAVKRLLKNDPTLNSYQRRIRVDRIDKYF